MDNKVKPIISFTVSFFITVLQDEEAARQMQQDIRTDIKYLYGVEADVSFIIHTEETPVADALSEPRGNRFMSQLEFDGYLIKLATEYPTMDVNPPVYTYRVIIPGDTKHSTRKLVQGTTIIQALGLAVKEGYIPKAIAEMMTDGRRAE